MADAVALAYLFANEVSASFEKSKMDLIGYDLANHQRVIRGGLMPFRCGSGHLVAARNEIAARFLDADPGRERAEWLFMIDSDMGFAPDTVDRLLASADPEERPVVGGLCFSMKELAPDGMGGWVTAPLPTIYDWVKLPDGRKGFQCRMDYPVAQLTKVSGTGAACLLVHRSVLERIREVDGDHWFTQKLNPSDGMLLSEDLSFCGRVGQLGIPIFIDTSVRTTHHKAVWLAEHAYWQQRPVPPADQQTAVIVPVLNRPGNAEPFMRSLRASTGFATVYAVANPDDASTVTAWTDAGATVLETEGVTFAEKVNHAYRRTTEPWLFLTGDDVTFYPAWLDMAQHVARTLNAQVIGTNDLANPRVTHGTHATHLLISRSYIDEHGGGWDGPGVVTHEGYRHWYVDDEIVTAAKARNEWAMAIGSLVEHHHPIFGKAETDSTYELGQSYADQDRKLFKGRLKSFAGKAA